MLRHRSIGLALTATTIFCLTSCSDQPTQPTAAGSPDLAATPVQQGPADDPVALARAVPGFGGFFLDQQGTPTVYLTQPAQRAAAERALAPWFREQNQAAAGLKVLPGRFAWADLERWNAQASVEALAIPGAVFADADEAANRVRIGVAIFSYRDTPAEQRPRVWLSRFRERLRM